ncbi:unnamed protein product [Brachionus calyciflorus]|uniref:Probable arginine--tRNA ligase, mitochondrial n=1 Tax=Brachionus calyciflorus TaxID=104777 RepID=A0A814D1X9_9BILA|nr:unnamed protein product [Brachionus calyciflorus]
MVSSFLKKDISLKISKLLNRYLKNEKYATDLHKKINYLTRVNRADKSSKFFGLLSLDLSKISNEIDLKQIKIDEPSPYSSIQSIKLDKNKLIIQADQKEFKKYTIHSIFDQKFNYGFNLEDQVYLYKNTWRPKKSTEPTIVEFSSPNIAKPLHAGHMRSTFLGSYLSNLHSRLGHQVTKINYLGDWGTQYGILAVGFEKYGSYEELNKSPIKHLLEVYVKANKDEELRNKALEYFSQMEQKNDKSLKMWNLFKDLSIKELVSVYKNLNIKFDVYESESEYYEKAKQKVQQLLKIGLAEQLEDGAVQAKLSTSGSVKKFILQKSDNSTLYITRDIAALCERKEKYGFKKIVYVVDSSQKDHFMKLYETVNALDASILNDISFEEFYVPFGRITNMSTRKGKVEFLSDLIQEAKQVAFESMEFSKTKKILQDAELVAQAIGNSHLIITDLGKPRQKDYEFSWKNIVSKDDSAYMCHYAHARLHSLLEKCRNELKIEPSIENVDLSLLNKQTELNLIQHLARFEEAVWQSYEEYEPYHVVLYLFQLVKLTNLCLKDSYVFNEQLDVAKARLLLFSCSKQVLQNSFNVLGINPLNSI